MRVFGIIDNKWSSQAVAVLVRDMRMVPKRASLMYVSGLVMINAAETHLIWDRKVILIPVPWDNWTLCYRSRPVIVVGAILVKPVPVLHMDSVAIHILECQKVTMLVVLSIVSSVRASKTLILKLSPWIIESVIHQ